MNIKEAPPIYGGGVPDVSRTKTFRTGGSVAVRLPKDSLSAGADVEVIPVPGGLLVREVANPVTVGGWWDNWTAMPDFMDDGRNELPLPDRDLTF